MEALRTVIEQIATRFPTALVIGFGNPLRGDDAVGWRVASAVAGWRLPDVHALAVHQLTPELAVHVASARLAIFVDARLAGEGEAFHLRSLGTESPGIMLGHIGGPDYLLALARSVYGSQPRASLITIPATNLDLGVGLSPSAVREMAAALRQIARLVREDGKSVAVTERLGGGQSAPAVELMHHAREVDLKQPRHKSAPRRS